MQWIALDEDVATLIASLVMTLDSIEGPELSRQGDIRAPTSADFEEQKASWQEFLQRSTETTSAAVLSLLPL